MVTVIIKGVAVTKHDRLNCRSVGDPQTGALAYKSWESLEYKFGRGRRVINRLDLTR